jgi:gas vesicle protein
MFIYKKTLIFSVLLGVLSGGVAVGMEAPKAPEEIRELTSYDTQLIEDKIDSKFRNQRALEILKIISELEEEEKTINNAWKKVFMAQNNNPEDSHHKEKIKSLRARENKLKKQWDDVFKAQKKLEFGYCK